MSRRLWRATVIYLDQPLPVGSAFRQATYPLAERLTYPLILGPSNGTPNTAKRVWEPSQLLGLAGGGVCPAGAVTDAAVRSYRTISTLPVFRQVGTIGCVFSVALSLGLPGPHFAIRRKMRTGPRWPLTTTVALSCSDFPPAIFIASDRPTHSF